MDEDIARAERAKKGSPFLSTEQAAFYLGLSARKLQQMRGQGTGPIFRRHSRCVRYHIDDLDNWSRGISGLNTARAEVSPDAKGQDPKRTGRHAVAPLSGGQ